MQSSENATPKIMKVKWEKVIIHLSFLIRKRVKASTQTLVDFYKKQYS